MLCKIIVLDYKGNIDDIATKIVFVLTKFHSEISWTWGSFDRSSKLFGSGFNVGTVK